MSDDEDAEAELRRIRSDLRRAEVRLDAAKVQHGRLVRSMLSTVAILVVGGCYLAWSQFELLARSSSADEAKSRADNLDKQLALSQSDLATCRAESRTESAELSACAAGRRFAEDLVLGLTASPLDLPEPPPDASARVLELADRCLAGANHNCNTLGHAYMRGRLGLDRDPAEALKWFGLGCRPTKGEPDALACRNGGILAFEGRGGDRDIPLAADLHRIGCELEDGVSCAALGYLVGAKLADDPRGALALYKLACEFESGRGCYRWGIEQRKLGEDSEAAMQRACELGEGKACP